MVRVHIIHGGVPFGFLKRPKEDIGGLFGGHVAIFIDGYYYGFCYANVQKIHWFPRVSNKNCIFERQNQAEWESRVLDRPETIVEIPFSEYEKEALLNFYRDSTITPAYDYATFGHRCASSCFVLLEKFRKVNGHHFILNAFYPASFRRFLEKQAQEKHYILRFKPGSNRRYWEQGSLPLLVQWCLSFRPKQ